MFNKVLVFIIILLISNFTVKSQTGVLKGRVVDEETNELLPFVNLTLEDSNRVLTSFSTDIDGNYFIKPRSTGTFNIKLYYRGYLPKQINNVKIISGDTSFLDIKLKVSAYNIIEGIPIH
jgi:hypothetical protein